LQQFHRSQEGEEHEIRKMTCITLMHNSPLNVSDFKQIAESLATGGMAGQC
jgi:hypothetical protein